MRRMGQCDRWAFLRGTRRKPGRFITPDLRKLRSCYGRPLSCGIGPKRSLRPTASTGCALRLLRGGGGPGVQVTSTSFVPLRNFGVGGGCGSGIGDKGEPEAVGEIS